MTGLVLLFADVAYGICLCVEHLGEPGTVLLHRELKRGRSKFMYRLCGAMTKQQGQQE